MSEQEGEYARETEREKEREREREREEGSGMKREEDRVEKKVGER